MIPRLGILLLAASLLGPAAAAADDSADPRGRGRERGHTVDGVLRALEEKREGISGLAARISRTEKKPDGSGNTEEITLFYRAPDRLRTEIGGARPRRVVINGDRMWFFHPTLEVVEQYDLPDEERRQQAMYEMSWGLTSPIMVLVRGMNRSLEELPSGRLLVNLVPDNDEIQLEEITARIDPARWEIEEMTIRRPGLPALHLAVVSWDPDTEPDEGLFSLDVPEGWDVFEAIEDSAPPQVQM